MKVKYAGAREISDAVTYSGLEIINEKFYLISFDTDQVLITDRKRSFEERFGINYPLNDAENVTSLTALSAMYRHGKGKDTNLLLLSAGNLLKINLYTKSSELVVLKTFMDRLAQAGVQEFVPVSSAIVNDQLVILSKPGDLLIVTEPNFFLKQDTANIHLIKVQLEKPKDGLAQLTAVEYSYDNDWLILSGNFASEDNKNGSSIAVVENGYRKIHRKKLKIHQTFFLAGLESTRLVSLSLQEDKKNKLKLFALGNAQSDTTAVHRLRIQD